MKPSRMGLIAHAHTGALRPHHHTSYGALLAVVLFAGGVAVFATLGGSESTESAASQASPAPLAAATITSPVDGQAVTAGVTISGNCSAGSFVTLSRNAVFGGTAVCGDDGSYRLKTNVFAGSTSLIATAGDAYDNRAKPSAAVRVMMPVDAMAAAGQELFLQSDVGLVLASAGQTVERSVRITGGTPPYAVAWEWGDGATSLSSQSLEGGVSARHAYRVPQAYAPVVNVTDGAGRTATMALVTSVSAAATGSTGRGVGHALLAAWPLYLIVIVVGAAFGLGELRETLKLRRLARREQAAADAELAAREGRN